MVEKQGDSREAGMDACVGNGDAGGNGGDGGEFGGDGDGRVSL
jgi:hypothetical protein